MQSKADVHSILWFRKGLRLHDNPALQAALKDAARVYPTFIIDPNFVAPEKVGVRRFNFLLESLHDLDRSLRALGSKLFVLRGNPVEILPRAIREWEINRIAFEKDTEPYAILRDKQIISMAKELDIEVICPVSHTLYDLDQLAGPSKTFPLTYSAFCNLIEHAGEPLKPLPPPGFGDFPIILKKEEDVGENGKDKEGEKGKRKEKEKEKEDEGSLDVYGIPTLHELGYPPIPQDKPTPWKGGETEALRRMIAYLKDKAKVAKFEKPKGNPCEINPTSTTVLSPYLKFGCLSVRRLYYALQEVYSSVRSHSQPPVSLLGQIYWREFFYGVSYLTPNFDRMAGNKICRQIPWGNDEVLFKAWKDGRTGYPWIDAAMIQLRDHGWLHHLARHAVACFLTRGDLWVSWEHGRDVFDQLLLDADWALNNANWMWLSASAFFHTYWRVYSPITFAKKYDPDGKYIKHFLPVLKDMPKQYIFAPWTAPLEVQRKAHCIIGVDYPKPVADHAVAMDKNMQRMKLAYAAEKLAKKRVGKDAGEAEEQEETEETERKASPVLRKTTEASSKPAAKGTKRKRATSEKGTKKKDQPATLPFGRAKPLKQATTGLG